MEVMAQKYAKIETEENETWLQKLPLGTTEQLTRNLFNTVFAQNLLIKWWNSLPLEIRTLSLLSIFNHSLSKYLQYLTRNYHLYLGDCSAPLAT